MFLLVSVRHVDAHPGGYQHGVSIQISINLGKKFLRISRIRNILLAWILPRNMVYLHPFISQIPDLIYWTVLIFILICFEWRDTENQQYFPRCTAGPNIVAIGHFRVPSGLCFKRRVGAQPLIWKSLFHPHANKTHFHKKGCAPRLIVSEGFWNSEVAYWKMLHPFQLHCQQGQNNSQHCWFSTKLRAKLTSWNGKGR